MPVMGYCKVLRGAVLLLLLPILPAWHGRFYRARAAFSSALRRLALTYTVCMVA